jgi:hypothetical protein
MGTGPGWQPRATSTQGARGRAQGARGHSEAPETMHDVLRDFLVPLTETT